MDSISNGYYFEECDISYLMNILRFQIIGGYFPIYFMRNSLIMLHIVDLGKYVSFMIKLFL